MPPWLCVILLYAQPTSWKVRSRPSQGISYPTVHIYNRDRETLRNRLFHY
jgi:hypothetical protein